MYRPDENRSFDFALVTVIRPSIKILRDLRVIIVD